MTAEELWHMPGLFGVIEPDQNKVPEENKSWNCSLIKKLALNLLFFKAACNQILANWFNHNN